MRKLSGPLLVGVLLLSGCSAPPAEDPVETPANAESCETFETVTSDLADRIIEGSDSTNADEFMETMSGMPARFDEAVLSGSGNVKKRIATLIENLPAKVHMLYIDSAKYFEDVESVSRACEADGSPVNAVIWE